MRQICQPRHQRGEILAGIVGERFVKRVQHDHYRIWGDGHRFKRRSEQTLDFPLGISEGQIADHYSGDLTASHSVDINFRIDGEIGRLDGIGERKPIVRQMRAQLCGDGAQDGAGHDG